MNGQVIGISWGLQLWFRYPKIAIFVLILFLVTVGWIMCDIHTQNTYYRNLQNMADSILQAEKVYYQKHGSFSAHLNKLDISLPRLLEKKQRQGTYAYKDGQKITEPDTYDALTEKGDRILVTVYNEQNSQIPSFVQIQLYAPDRTLPAYYSVRHYEGGDLPAQTFYECKMLPPAQQQPPAGGNRGGSFCKRLGASPTHDPLVYFFQ